MHLNSEALHTVCILNIGTVPIFDLSLKYFLGPIGYFGIIEISVKWVLRVLKSEKGLSKYPEPIDQFEYTA